MDAFIMIIAVVIIFSFGAIFAALFYIMYASKTQKNLPVVHVRAEVIGTNASNMSSSHSKDDYDHTSYFAEFKLEKDNSRVILNVSKKAYVELLSGYYGDLVYQGNKLLSFERLESHEEMRHLQKENDGYFFIKRKTKHVPVDFYCEAKTLDIIISASEPIQVDYDEVSIYIDDMLTNFEENFFGLDNGKQVIQFFNDGENDEIVIDIPVINQDASYQAVIYGTDKVKEIVEAYFNKEDVLQHADFELMKF